MNTNSKVKNHHREKPAYIYLRQSTIGQVYHNRESTERQYALKDKALEMGWPEEMIRVLDGDLGISGASSAGRNDFNILVADVSMGKVGAVFALEASRLSRLNSDWQRLLELCSLTNTIIIDSDGCYDPSDFNDSLLLGIKGSISQAELHFIRLRLYGGKLNKAQKGELKFPLPVGLCYDDQANTVLDPDEEIRGAVQLLFKVFHETGSAYAVVQYFARNNLKFPKRAYGGVWDGKILWGHLTHSRVLGVLKNPSYAGTYVYGRYQCRRNISEDGKIHSKMAQVAMPDWRVKIQDHHERYIDWDQYLENQKILDSNRTNKEEMLLTGPAREGKAILQGLLLCSKCGHRLFVRYKGNGGIYSTYECVWRKRYGFTTKYCLAVRCDLLDKAVTKRMLEVIQPAQIEIAINALTQLEQREKDIDRQWQMKLERAHYEGQLAERRYCEVDPSNRLVAATLERRWNEAIVKVKQIQEEYELKCKQALKTTYEDKEKLLSLAKDLPRLWNASTTQDKDRKRILRLFITDITVEKNGKKVILHIRWKGGASEDIEVTIPPSVAEQVRYPREMVEKIRDLAKQYFDHEIAEKLNQQGLISSKGKSFTISMIKWIRYQYKIPRPQLRAGHEWTVKETAKKFNVSTHVVYYWIERRIVQARKIGPWVGNLLISIDQEKEKELIAWVTHSPRIKKVREKQNN